MTAYLVPPATVNDAALTATNVPEADYAAWAVGTAYAAASYVILTSTHMIYKCAVSHQGAAAATATVTMTIAAPCVVTWTAHGLAAGTEIVFQTTGALPSGLVAGTSYFVSAPAANTFNLAATMGGVAITTTGTQTGTHTAIVSSTSPAVNSAKWSAVSATNRWKMFDTSNSTATAVTSPLSVTVAPGYGITAVGLMGLSGTSARIRVTDPVAGTIYDKTTILTGVIPAADWYTYFMAVVQPISTVIALNIPSYANCSVLVDIAGTGTVQCGTFVCGYQIPIGATDMDYGARLGIIDYSGKTTDSYGNIVLTKRSYAKRATFNLQVSNTDIDTLNEVLATWRSTPCLWIGNVNYPSTQLFGIFQSYDITIAYPTYSILSLDLLGLT